MPIDPPTGYLTRPEAAKRFNRSQRALERDLDVALTIQDQELLSHWKLLTKDGNVRDAGEVSLEMVKNLVTDGMTPAWCIAESYLEEKYGRKGQPRPRTSIERISEAAVASPADEAVGKRTPPVRSEPLRDDTVFLKELVRTLEREKEQERERHDRIVSKFFGELDVKNKQISAWDEVTQGLTKALATGQIAPNHGYLLTGSQSGMNKAQEAVDVSSSLDSTPLPVDATSKETSRQPQKNPTRNKNKTAPAASRKTQVDKQPTKDQQPRIPKWHEFPTFKKLFSRH